MSMRPLNDDELLALGFSADAELEPLESDNVPMKPEAHGLAERIERTPAEERYSRAAKFDAFLTPLGGHVWRHDDVDAYFSVDVPVGSRVQRKGDVIIEDDRVRVDARKQPGFVRVIHDDNDLTFIFRNNNIELLRQKTAPSPEVARILQQGAREPVQVPRPDPAQLVDGASMEPWLREAADALAAQGSPLARVAAAGLIARLWIPTTPQEIKRVTEQLLNGGDDPSDRAGHWLKALGPAVMLAVEQLAVAEAQALLDELLAIQEAVRHGREVSAAALSWLDGRDDLASVELVLRKAKQETALTSALALLDERASLYHALWSDLELPDDLRLSAVSVQEPDAWWGTLLRG